MPYLDYRELDQVLVGRYITDFEISEDRNDITFFLKNGKLVLACGGDCCSTTWIESIDDSGALHGLVLSAEEVSMPDLGSVATHFRPEVDEVQYYGLKVTTENGRCVIDYRNDSNGYYGGNLYVLENIVE